MNTEPESVYTKHVYWLVREEDARLREDMRARGIEMKPPRGIVCRPLNGTCEISSVAPEVWNETCARQGSWYRASDKNGLYLVVSSFELESHPGKKAATITQSGFEPPKQANRDEKEGMAHNPEFVDQIPSEWGRVDEAEKTIYLRWAKRLGSKANDYEFLYLSHTANHANFLKPRFSVKKDGIIIPYSIDRSAHLCSCCLELFQVLGTAFPKKLVAPCPGATIFARLAPDRYLLVEEA